MGYLDEFQTAHLVSDVVAIQIRSAYGSLLTDFQRRERAGERFVLADLIAYQFLLDKLLGASAICDAGAMPPLVRRLPLGRLHQDEAVPQPASTCAADRASSSPCAHCSNAAECKQLGCEYDELLISIAARLGAIKAA